MHKLREGSQVIILMPLSRLTVISKFQIIRIFHSVRYGYCKTDKLHLHLCAGVFAAEPSSTASSPRGEAVQC